MANGQVPRPSLALAKVLAGRQRSDATPHDASESELARPGPAGRRDSKQAATLPGPGPIGTSWRGAGSLTKAALVLVVTVTVVTIAGAVQVLPGRAQHLVGGMLEAITPLELRDEGREGTSPRVTEEDDKAAHRGRLRPGEAAVDPSSATGTAPAPDGGERAPSERPYPTGSPSGSGQRPGAPRSSEPAPGPDSGRHAADHYTATMTGAAQVPGPGDPDGGGTALLSIDSGRNLLCLTLTVTGIEPPTSIHVHEGPAEVTGPVVASLTPGDDGSPACVPLAPDVVNKIRENLAGHYVDVHNAEFPDGALRGQLS